MQHYATLQQHVAWHITNVLSLVFDFFQWDIYFIIEPVYEWKPVFKGLYNYRKSIIIVCVDTIDIEK